MATCYLCGAKLYELSDICDVCLAEEANSEWVE